MRHLSAPVCAFFLVACTAGAAPKPLPAGIVARVNGVPIRQEMVTDRLWRESGSVYTDYAVRQRVVREEAAQRGLSVTPEELEARMSEYHAQFTSAPGRQPGDWDAFVARFTLKRIEAQQRDDLLVRKIGEQEAKAAFLTPAETERVLTDLDRDSHSVHVRHVFVGVGPQYGGRSRDEARGLANAVLEKIATGTSWDEAAKAYSDDVSTFRRGGDMGFLTRGQLAAPLAAVAFSASDGASQPVVVDVPEGFEVFQVTERKANPPSEDDKRKALDAVLARKREIAAEVASWYPAAEKRLSVRKHLPYQQAGPALPKGIVAVVGRQSVPKSEVEERMWRELGQLVVDREINKQIIRQEAKARGFIVAPAQVLKEFARCRADFVKQSRRPASDWDKLVARVGRRYWDDDITVQMLTAMIARDEGRRVSLSAADRKRVRGLVDNRSHQVHARDIVIGMGSSFANRTDADARKLVDEALARLKAGETWEAIAKHYSTDEDSRDKGGDLGFIAHEADERLPEEVLTVLFATNPGSDPQIVKAPNGYHIVQALARRTVKPTAAQYQQALNKALADKRGKAKALTTWFPRVMLKYRVECTMPYARGL